MNERGDLRWGTIPWVVEDAARRFGDAEAIADGDVRMSFNDVADAMRAAAAAYIATGIDRGDAVAIWAPNSWQWIVAATGAQSAGAHIVPLNTRFKGREAAYILQKSGVRALVTLNGFLGADYIAMLGEFDLPDLETLVVFEGEVGDGAIGWEEFLARGTTVSPDAVSERIAAGTATDLSDVMFTSGTTGNPKGVMLEHGQALRAYYDWSSILTISEGDRYLIVNPFHHSFGYKAGWLVCLMHGATVVPVRMFDARSAVEMVQKERITVLPGPPTLFQSILSLTDLAEYDVSTLRVALTGAAAVPVELVRRMFDELPFEVILTGYGLTEATATGTVTRPGDDAETIATTAGRPFPDLEVRVVDVEGNSLVGEPGEVVIRGYSVMRGYLDDPDATAAAIDADGWLHTGDVGVIDERGNVRITDRIKDMFIAGGFNAYPAEIENTLCFHPAIAQAAVIGVPDERLGEVAMAFVILRPGAELTEDELIAWCRKEMANFKVPRFVRFVDALPLNATGKVLKYELRDLAAKERAGA